MALSHVPLRVLLVAAFALRSVGLLAASAPPSPVIVGYVFPRGDELGVDPAAAAKLTHLNLAFVPIEGGKLVDGPQTAAHLARLRALRDVHPKLKLLVSVGGWLGSGGFSDIAASPAARTTFVTSALAFLDRHALDGLDVDWEYPGLPGSGNRHRPQDRENFSALLRELRAGLDAGAARGGRARLLTIAAGASDSYLSHVEPGKVAAACDLVHLMTYDFRVPEAGDQAGHHTNLRAPAVPADQLSAERVVRSFLAAGMPASRLTLGVPFYGRAWRGVRRDAEGLHSGKPAPALDVSNWPAIDKLSRRRDWVREWDEAAQAPFLWNAAECGFVSYDDPRSLALKARFVRENGLAGLMFWELHGDPGGVLLDVLFQEVADVAR